MEQNKKGNTMVARNTTSTEIIEIQIPTELAQRLQPYRNDLARILEWGLRYVEEKTETATRAIPTPEAMALQKRVVAALRQMGVVGPEPEEIAPYLLADENQNWAPIQAGGKSASEMIVEERDSRPWTKR
jgi:hypothetical protein